jgi:hypothetical protein
MKLMKIEGFLFPYLRHSNFLHQCSNSFKKTFLEIQYIGLALPSGLARIGLALPFGQISSKSNLVSGQILDI